MAKKDTQSSTDDTVKKEAPATLLASVIKDFKASWEYTQGSWHDRWRDNYKLYNNQRVSVGYAGISNVFVPMVYGTVETLTSGLYGGNPKVDYIPPTDKQKDSTAILNSLFDYYWDKDQWSLKVPETGRYKFMLGTSVDYFAWNVDHIELIHVPIRDFFIDPNAYDIETARYMGRRYLTTVADLKTYEVVDPETGDMVPKYKNLDSVMDYKNPDQTDKEEKDMWYGSTITNPEDGQVECIEYWGQVYDEDKKEYMDKVVTIANRCCVIEDSENYFKARMRKLKDKNPKAVMPFADDRDVIDPSLFFAKSTVDFIAGQQEQLNDLSNQLADALTYTINQQYTIDPDFAHLQGQVRNLPGATYIAGKDAISPIIRGQIPPDAFLQIQNIKNEIRETTGANEILKGSPSEGGNATATEINAQIAGAGQRISLKVTQLENGYFHRMARIVFAFVRCYVTEKMMVRIVGKDGAKWEEFDPKEYAEGNYEPRVQLDIRVENKKAEDAATGKEMLSAFLGDPEVNQLELKKMVLAKSFYLDPDEVALLMQPNPKPEEPPQEPGMDAMMGQDPMMAGMPMDPSMMMPPEMPMDAGAGMGMPPEMQGPSAPEPIMDEATGQIIDANTGLPLEVM